MRIRVLGSAAGGGFPQWNCHCRNCAGVRNGTLRASARTQSSIAVNDGDVWTLINASPDVLQQLAASPSLRPARAIRDTAIQSIVLTDAQIDHTNGLYLLREAIKPWHVWCTDQVATDLTHNNPIFPVLNHYCGIEHRRIVPSLAFSPSPNIRLTGIPLLSKPPPFSPSREAPQVGDNIALRIEDSRLNKVFYAPGVGAMTEDLWAELYTADCVMIDGTFWTEDEMLRLELSKKPASTMGHLPQAGVNGDAGMIDYLNRLPPSTRKILIHINNSNPILDEDSPERAVLANHNIEVAYDGMEIDL
jgi:pyrroloquinoline quinone biosynthesis protein B